MNLSFVDSLLNRNPVSPYVSNIPQRRNQRQETESEDSSIQFATILHAKLQDYWQESNPFQANPTNSLFATSGDSFGITHKLAQSRADQTTPTEFGYSIDSNGFFTSDFNKAAGIPDDFKIHVDSVRNLEYANTTTEWAGAIAGYKSIDIVATIGSAYQTLSNLMGDSLNQTSFSAEQIAQIPQGFATHNGMMNGTLKAIYQTASEREQAQESFNNSLLGLVGLNPGISQTFIDDIFDTNRAANRQKESKEQQDFYDKMLNWGVENYYDEVGNLSKGGLLMGFALSQKPVGEENTMQLSGIPKVGQWYQIGKQPNAENIQSYWEIAEGKSNLAEYLQEHLDQDNYFAYYLLQQGIRNLQNLSFEQIEQLRAESDKTYSTNNALHSANIFNSFVEQLVRDNQDYFDNSQKQANEIAQNQAKYNYEPTTLDKLIEAYSGLPSYS